MKEGMKSNRLYCLICIFLCATFTGKSQSSYVVAADSLFLAGDYAHAALMYEHASFLSSGIDATATLLLKKVDCLKNINREAEITEVLDRMRYDVLPAAYHARWRYESALAAYINGDYERAINEVSIYENFIQDTVFINDMLLIKALSCHSSLKWTEAAAAMKKLITTAVSDSVAATVYLKRIDELYGEVPSVKNPEKGARLSGFVPGLGQLYAGYPLDAMASAAINLGALTLGIYNVLNGFPISGYMSGAGLIYAFYIGGQKRAMFLCEKRNYKTRRELDEEVKMIFREITVK
jgi:hypothetical protein